MAAAFACSPSSSTIRSTSVPMRQESVLPPKVEKNSIPLSNERAMSAVVSTAPIGWPFPNGLPSTTMSGSASCASNPQKYAAEPAEPRLDLVGDAHPARGTDAFVHRLQVADRRDDLASDAREMSRQ